MKENHLMEISDTQAHSEGTIPANSDLLPKPPKHGHIFGENPDLQTEFVKISGFLQIL